MAAVNYDEIVWIDVNSNFGQDVDPEIVIDVSSINNSLFNLFNCPVGSRPFERNYGSRLLYLLFNPVDGISVDGIQASLFQSIRIWEPRIAIDRARSSVTESKDGTGFDITIAYTVLRTKLNSSYAFTIRRI